MSPEQIRAAWSEAGIDSGWMEPGTVRCGINRHGRWAVQFIKPMRPSLLLLGANASDTGGAYPASVWLRLPPLVLIGIGGRYHLFAVKSEEFDPHVAIFRAPFPNVYGGEHICFGANPIPKMENEGMQRAMRLFFESPFTSMAIEGKSKRYPSDVRLHLIEHGKRGVDEFYPLDDLVVYEAYPTINLLLEAMIGA